MRKSIDKKLFDVGLGNWENREVTASKYGVFSKNFLKLIVVMAANILKAKEGHIF